MDQRGHFTSKMGFVLAGIGSAIGLANVWMFPWRLGQYGGGAFLVPYLLFLVLLGIPGLMGEFALGRSQQRGCLGAVRKIMTAKGLPASGVGILPVITATAVIIFYAIVVGWLFRYLLHAIGNDFATGDVKAMFDAIHNKPAGIPWHALALLVTMGILLMGVVKGIEKSNKIMMPVLFVLLVVLLFRSLTLPGAMEGVKYLLVPKWHHLANVETWIMALGQAFFTISLGGSGMVTYGSYLKDDIDIPKSALQIVSFDTIAAFMAAFIIIPAAFAFGQDPSAGPPLLFLTLPHVFGAMPMGQLFSILFYISMIFAATSSAIALLEVPVEAIIDRLSISRTKAVIMMTVVVFAVGIPMQIETAGFKGADMFHLFVDIVSSYINPMGALLAGIAFFIIYGGANALKEINKGASIPVPSWFPSVGRFYVIGSAIVVILSIIKGGIG